MNFLCIEMAVFWVVVPCSLVEVYRRFRGTCTRIVLLLEAASSSETLVNIYQTTQNYNPKDSRLHTRRREKLKSYKFLCITRKLMENMILHRQAVILNYR
jgi:hypothetical protein